MLFKTGASIALVSVIEQGAEMVDGTPCSLSRRLQRDRPNPAFLVWMHLQNSRHGPRCRRLILNLDDHQSALLDVLSSPLPSWSGLQLMEELASPPTPKRLS